MQNDANIEEKYNRIKKEIDIAKIEPSVFPREGVFFGEYEPMLTDLRVPALFPLGDTNGMCFLQTSGNKEIIYKTIQSFILRLLLQINPGLLKLTLYDGAGSGKNLIGLSQIDRKIKGENILTSKDELKRALESAVSDINNTIQKVLGHKYFDKTLIDYNEDAGKLAKNTYRIICLADFPNGLNKELFDLVFKIVQSGRQAGVFVIMGLDTEWKPENDYEKMDVFSLLKDMGVIYEADERWYVKNIPDSEFINEKFNLYLNNYFPNSSTLDIIQKHITETLKKAEKVEVDIHSKLSSGKLWEKSSSDGIEVPIGQLNITDLQYFSLSVEDGTTDVPHHCLVGGATGSGKTVLLHNVICNTALLYSPDEVQFILLDYKEGTEFKVYENLPHAKVLSIHSEREYGVSVLKYINREIEERGKKFKETNAQSITKYREKTGEKMPRLLVIIDEFQKLLDGDMKTTSMVSDYFDNIGRLGRSFGIHLILSSQSLSGIDINKTLSHLGLRITLKLNTEKDCDYFLGQGNHAPYKDLQKKGEAIYNARSGLTEGNVRFQVAYLKDSDIGKITSSLQGEYKPFHRYLYDGSVSASIANNKNIPEKYKPDPKFCDVYIGEPVALEEKHSCYRLRRQNESNVLIVGQDISSAMSILYHSIMQIVPQSPEGNYVYVCNKVNVDNECYDKLAPLMKTFSNNVKILGEDSEIEQTIVSVFEEVEKRKSKESSNNNRIVLAFADIYNARNLRKSDYSNSPLSQKLITILKDGPGFGIHSIVHASSFENLKQIIDVFSMPNEFEVKIELRGGEGYKIFGNNGDEKSTPRNLNIANIQTPQVDGVSKVKVYSL